MPDSPKTFPAAAPGVPGVPAGATTTPSVAAAHAAGASGGPGSTVHAAKTVPLFGGNVGGRKRADGLAAGSPEAVQADKEKDAARKRADRAAKSAATEPPPLPAAVAGETKTPPVAFGAALVDPVAAWTPEDFRDAAPELVELAEAWRIDAHTKRAIAAKLSRKVVEAIAKDAAFPAASKRSLSSASPLTLAQMFNALKVPIRLRTGIAVVPALVCLYVHDRLVSVNLTKYIEAESGNAETKPSPAAEVKP